MKNGEQPINPIYNSEGFIANTKDISKEHGANGLTKREYFAALAMQGLCVNAGRNGHEFKYPKKIAQTAIEVADNLLSELEKEEKQ